VKGFAINPENATWLEKACEKEGLNQSQVVNRLIKKAKDSGILW
jgi:hypothetical protein